MTQKQRWIMERRKKYRTATGADSKPRPRPGTRQQCFVSPYTRQDGIHVRGHYRAIDQGRN